jgi:hypothetical protein
MVNFIYLCQCINIVELDCLKQSKQPVAIVEKDFRKSIERLNNLVVTIAVAAASALVITITIAIAITIAVDRYIATTKLSIVTYSLTNKSSLVNDGKSYFITVIIDDDAWYTSECLAHLAVFIIC